MTDVRTTLPEPLRTLSLSQTAFGVNLARAHHLTEHFKKVATGENLVRFMDAGDILRAAVVLAHASLEEFLRAVIRAYLPYASAEKLGTIPLIGLQTGGRAEKFTLGMLKAHSSKSVQSLIQESIDSHVQRSTFNSVSEIASHLESLSLPVSANLKALFPAVQSMIERRHEIVHQADKLGKFEEQPVQQWKWRPILYDQVVEWIEATFDAVTVLAGDLITYEVLKRDGRDPREILDRLRPFKGMKFHKTPSESTEGQKDIADDPLTKRAKT